MTKDCNICYFPIEGIHIKCSDTSCLTEICVDCLASYIDFHFKNGKGIPKCPMKTCKNGEILLSEIEKSQNVELVKKYTKLIINHLKNDNVEDILAETNKQLMVKKIRKERHEFILKEYPKAIAFVIETSLKSKLNMIDKKNQEHIKEIVKKTNKKCPNSLCYSGILDVDFTCLSCSQQFCKKCEVKKEENHVCKNEDIETLKLVDNMVKCPKCKLPVVKSYGCHNMTCSICKTNFDYITGKITVAGNHSNDTLILKKQQKISKILLDECYDPIIVNYMIRIENKEPENFSFNNIITLLKKYITIENEDPSNIKELEKLELKMVENYETYKKYKYKNKNYYKYILSIQEAYENKKLTLTFLVSIDNSLKYE
jgi:hypothetical protein